MGEQIRNNSMKPCTAAHVERIRALAGTHTAAEMGKILRRTEGSIRGIAKKHGISLFSGCHKSHTMQDIEEIVRLRHQGLPFKEIARLTGLKVTSCQNIYRRHG